MKGKKYMQENTTMSENPQGCQCHGCSGSCCGPMHGHGHKHFLLRWLLAVIALGLVFGLGVKVGEFKAVFGGYDGYGHGSRANKGMMYWGGDSSYPVMYKRVQLTPQSNTATTTVQTTKSK